MKFLGRHFHATKRERNARCSPRLSLNQNLPNSPMSSHRIQMVSTPPHSFYCYFFDCWVLLDLIRGSNFGKSVETDTLKALESYFVRAVYNARCRFVPKCVKLVLPLSSTAKPIYVITYRLIMKQHQHIGFNCTSIVFYTEIN